MFVTVSHHSFNWANGSVGKNKGGDTTTRTEIETAGSGKFRGGKLPSSHGRGQTQRVCMALSPDRLHSHSDGLCTHTLLGPYRPTITNGIASSRQAHTRRTRTHRRTCARNSTLKYHRREYRSGYTASTPGAPPVRRFSFEPTAPAPEIAFFPTILSAAGNRDVHVTRPKLLAFSSPELRARRLFDAVASRC